MKVVTDSFSLFSGSLMRDPVVMIHLYPEIPAEVIKSLATRGNFFFFVIDSLPAHIENE